MLGDLSLAQALLMTAAATAVVCTAMGTWVPHRRFRIWFPVIMAGCAAGAVVLGGGSGYPAHRMLVLWSFTLIGLAVGMFPFRTWLTRSVHDAARGVTGAKYRIPRWRWAFFFVSLTVMVFAGAVLTTPR